MKSSVLKSINTFFDENKGAGIVVAVICFILILFFSLTTVYERFELFLYDIRFEMKAKHNSIKEWDQLVFLDINDASIATLGEFPWPRNIYAKGIYNLHPDKIEISQATFDIMFPDYSTISLNQTDRDKLYRMASSGYRIRKEDLEQVIQDNDRIFADSIATVENSSVLLAYTFSEDVPAADVLKKQQSKEFIEAKNLFLDKSTIRVPADKTEYYKSLGDNEVRSILYPIPPLMKTAHAFGFVNRHTDIDQTLRNVKLVRYFDGRIYFNLALMMIIDFGRVRFGNIEIIPGKHIVLKNAFNPMLHKYQDITIPIDKNGMMYVNWTGLRKNNRKKISNNLQHIFKSFETSLTGTGKQVHVTDSDKKSFVTYPFYALIEYEKYIDTIVNYRDQIDRARGFTDPTQTRLNSLYSDLAVLIEQYYILKDDEKRIKTWDAIKKQRHMIWEEQESYKKEINIYLAELKKKIAASKSRKRTRMLQEELELRKDDIQALTLAHLLERELADKITLTSWTGTGTTDLGRTPLWKDYPRVGIYHNIINTIMQQDFIKKLRGEYCYIIFILLSLIMGMSIQRMDARMSLLTIVSSLILVNIILLFVFVYYNLWVQQLGINLAVLIPSLSIASVKFLSEESQKKFIKKAFSRYLAPAVINQILEHPETLELGGESRVITSYFSDVAKFSTLSERLTPGELVALLNEYLSEMTEIILNYGGTVDKYEGDAIIAFYGAPHPFEDHAVKACMATIDMKRRLQEMCEMWRKQGRDELSVRMGMNTGEAVVGNMGSKNRMDYTAMGDTINLASRLEGANKFYDTSALISETTYIQAKEHIDARRLDIIRVVGKEQPIIIYELLGKKGLLPQRIYDMLEHFETGLDYFSKRQWKRAMAAFDEGLKLVADDGPCQKYKIRCQQYIKKAPPANWDGVYRLGSK